MKKKKIKKMLIGAILVAGGIIIGQYFPNMKSQQSVPKSGTLAMYIENEYGGYDLSNQTSFPTDGYVLNTEKSICNNGGTISQDSESKKLSVSVSNKDECTVYFDKEKDSTSSNILAHLNQSSNGLKTSFYEPATTDEGIFEMEDDYGTSYYFRGAVENNYVRFAGFYWRIIRINGNGSLRIIYDGTKGYANGTINNDRFAISKILFPEKDDDLKYQGWMYGPAGTVASTSKEQAQSNIADSDAKIKIDAWYKTNIEDKGYGDYVSDTLFCNDRSLPGPTETLDVNDTGLGYGVEYSTFGAHVRFATSPDNPMPTFKCPQKNDAFTVSDERIGNGDLTYPVGMITVDEIVTAGSGRYGKGNQKYYLYNGNVTLTMTPGSGGKTKNSSFGSFMFGINVMGALIKLIRNDTGVSPVINLKSEYVNTMIGTGTITDPYRAP